MTISTTTSRALYAGNGVTTIFSFPYLFLANGDLEVRLIEASGASTVLTLTTDYTVTGANNDAGGDVTMIVAPASGEQLLIRRIVDLTQETAYPSGDSFPAESHERALDKLTMMVQQHDEELARTIQLPVTSTEDTDALTDDIVLLADNLTTLDTVAGSIDDVQAVAAIDADVSVVAANIADVTNFADVYIGPSATDPTLRADGTFLQIGDLYFNTTTSLIRVYSSAGWLDAQTPVPITITRQQFNGTGAQTAFTLSSAPPFLNALFVEVSGVALVPSVAYTLSGTTLTFTAAPAAGTGNILARWFSPIAAGVPNDGSVSLAKLDGAFVLPIAQGGTGQTSAAASLAALGISDGQLAQPGDLKVHYANSAPTGWLKANGAAVSRTTYAALFARVGTTGGVGDGSTTFNLPDLRGEFIRGWDDSRGVDSGRVFGSAQSSANLAHTHTPSDGGVFYTSAGGGGFFGGGGIPVGVPASTNSSGGAEARPRNIAALVCIKF